MSKKKQLWTKLLFVLTFVCLSSSSLMAKTIGTVHTHDGVIFENISFNHNSMLKTISFEYENQKIFISFAEIDKIYDVNNQDITKSILGKVPKKQNKNQKKIKQWGDVKEEWTEDIDEKSWKVAFLAQPSFTGPARTYYKGLESGLSVGGAFVVALTEEYSMRFSYGTVGISVPDDLIIFLVDDPDYQLIDQSIKYTSQRMFLSLQVQQPFDLYDEDDISFLYGYAGIGLVTEKTTVSVTIREISTNNLYADQIEFDDTFESVCIGGGFIKMLSKTVGLNVEFSLDMVGAFDEQIEANLFDVRIGLALVL